MDDEVGDYGTENCGTEQQLLIDDDDEEEGEAEYDEEDAKTIMEAVDCELVNLTEGVGPFSSEEVKAHQASVQIA